MIFASRNKNDLVNLISESIDLSMFNFSEFQISFSESQIISTSNNPTNSLLFEIFGLPFLHGENFYVFSSQENVKGDKVFDTLKSLENQSKLVNVYHKIKSLWDIQHSWGSCYDLINVLLSSSPVILISSSECCEIDNVVSNFPHNFLIESGDTESDFSLSGGLWTIVKSLEVISTKVIPSNENIVQNEDDWEIIQMNENLNGIMETEQISPSTKSDSVGSKSAQPIVSFQSSSSPPSSSSDVRLSYKDIVLKASTKAEESQPVEKTVQSPNQTKHKWKPQIVVSKVPYIRRDRLYGPQPDIFYDDGKIYCN
jgi:hypothetical protein